MAPFKQTTLPAHYRGDQTFGRPSGYRPEYGDMLIDVTANFRMFGLGQRLWSAQISKRSRAREEMFTWIRCPKWNKCAL
ncbi:hypothetical protein ACVIJW_000160 [Bradyrhizobium barranii subsp. barranii]